jgi:two-component system, NarL family, sensor histidine kinase UhpB
MTLLTNSVAPPVPEKEALVRYNLLSLATREGIWDYDLDSGVTWYNQGIVNLFGYTPAEMKDNVGWWQGNIHPADRDRVIPAVDKFLQSRGNTWHGEYRFRCSNGEYKTVIEHLYAVRDENGVAKRLMGTMQDLDPIKKLLDEVEKERLNHRNEMIKAITESAEKERKLISDELHENINQVLAAISMHIEQAKEYIREDGELWLNQAQQLLLSSMKGIKRLSQQLSPLQITHLGLKEALESQLENVTQHKEIEYVLYTDHDVEETMSQQQKLFLYRIICLQLDNIMEHAQASIIKIHITKSGDHIRLTINDNGRGFDVARVTPGVGLLKIQERVPAYGGSYRIITSPGNGCTVEVIL